MCNTNVLQACETSNSQGIKPLYMLIKRTNNTTGITDVLHLYFIRRIPVFSGLGQDLVSKEL